MSPEELMFSNCGAGEDFWQSLGQQVAYGMLSMEFTQNTGVGSLAFLQRISGIEPRSHTLQADSLPAQPWGHKELDMTEWLNWTELDSKEFKPVNPKGNQPWIFIGRSEAEAEAPIPWPPDVKNCH